MSQDIELSIIMPCLNEIETLGTCIKKAKQWLSQNNVSGEIIIGDNGSTDGSVDLAKDLGAHVVHVEAKGYGSALFYATQAARGKYVIMGDSDDSYEFSNLAPFLEKLREGYGLVMGNRFTGGIAPGAMPWKNRYIGNPALSWIGRVLFRTHIRDMHCGLRGFSKEAFKRMDLKTSGMEYASEMVVKACIMNIKLCEVPTTLNKDGRSRPPHLRPWRDGWRHLRFMLLYSPRWVFWYPGWLLFAIGLFLMAWIFPGPREINGIVLDIHSMLYGEVIAIVGYQATTFGYIAKKLGIRIGILPESFAINSRARLFELEIFLLIGLFFLLSGISGMITTFASWAGSGFIELVPSVTFRYAIISSFFTIIGLQTIFFGFINSFIDLGVRKD